MDQIKEIITKYLDIDESGEFKMRDKAVEKNMTKDSEGVYLIDGSSFIGIALEGIPVIRETIRLYQEMEKEEFAITPAMVRVILSAMSEYIKSNTAKAIWVVQIGYMGHSVQLEIANKIGSMAIFRKNYLKELEKTLKDLREIDGELKDIH